MLPAHWEADYASLHRTLQTKPYTSLLDDLQAEYPDLPPIPSWTALLPRIGQDLTGEAGRYAAALWRSHHGGDDPRWQTVLTTLFWVPLAYLWRKSLRSKMDPDELWSSIQFAFLEAAERFEPKESTKSFGDALWQATRDRLRNTLRQFWTQQRRELLLDDPPDPERHKNHPYFASPDLNAWQAFHDVDDEEEQTVQVRGLARVLREGRITETEYHLLVGIAIYETPIIEYCRDHGLDYEATRKRYQRLRRRLEGSEGGEA